MSRGWYHGVYHAGDEASVGIPPGGSATGVLRKQSSLDYDVDWELIPKITVSATPPVAPAVNDIWIDIS